MGIAVSLRRVVEELEALMDDCTACVNRETGEIYALRDEDVGLVEDGANPEDLPECQLDEMPKIRQVLESEEWLPLPTTFDIHEWAIMNEFARSIDDSDLRDELLNAIRGAEHASRRTARGSRTLGNSATLVRRRWNRRC
jgi:hypothetical protein